MTTRSKSKSKSEPVELGPRLRGLVIPPGVELPPALAEENDRIRTAAVAAQAAADVANRAAAAAREAGDADQAAAIRAVEAGDGVFEMTAAPKRTAAKEAVLRATATEELVGRRARELRTAVRANPDYLRDRVAEVELARAEVEDALARLPELFASLERAQGLARPARRIIEESWSGPVFEPARSEERRKRDREKAERLREQRGPHELPTFEQCLADLRYIVEGEMA